MWDVHCKKNLLRKYRLFSTGNLITCIPTYVNSIALLNFNAISFKLGVDVSKQQYDEDQKPC